MEPTSERCQGSELSIPKTYKTLEALQVTAAVSLLLFLLRSVPSLVVPTWYANISRMILSESCIKNLNLIELRWLLGGNVAAASGAEYRLASRAGKRPIVNTI